MTLNDLANSNLTIHKEPLHNPDSFVQAWKPQSLKSEATTLPAEMYTSPKIYQLEIERVFGKAWYYVGHIWWVAVSLLMVEIQPEAQFRIR